MKKHLLLFAILFLSFHCLFSQDLNLNIDSLKTASYIFKGTVISETPFKANNNKEFFISYILKVETIYKGENELKLGTVNLVIKSPVAWTVTEEGYIIYDLEKSDYASSKDEENAIHPFSLGIGISGVFACKTLSNIIDIIPKSQTVNSIVLEPICNTSDCFFQYIDAAKYDNENKNVIENKYIKGFGKKFNSLNEVIDFLKKANIISQNENNKKKDVVFLGKVKQNEQNELIYAKRVKSYGKLLKEYQLLQQQNLQSKKTDTDKSIENISFTFENPIETGSNPKYFEFDIMASGSSNNTYLDMAMFHLKYNSQVFGTHAVLNNRVQVTRGSNFNNINYTDPDTVMDDKIDTFSVMISRNGELTLLNRTPITTIPQTLLHVKMEIVNCTSTTNIEFVDMFFTGMFTTYTDTPNEPATSGGNPYDNVDYPQILTHYLCPSPIITNMFPNPITSGTNTVLTIQGYNFGNTRDTGQVWMYNDDDNNTLIKHFDYIDYVPASWSDTEIKFIVPSTVDTLHALGYEKGVGSGHISVKRSDGAVGISSVPLEISYANMNISIAKYTSSYQKIPIRVIADYLDTAKFFYLDTSITNSSMKDIAITEAVRRWSCNTLINWEIKGDTIKQHFADGISVIFMENTFHGNPLARTWHTNGSVCTDDNNAKVAYYNDIDIGISRDFNNISANEWLIDTSYTQDLEVYQHDFFAVAQHELGHVHSLSHVNDNTDIMYHANITPANAINRFDLYSSPDAVIGGNYIREKSEQMNSCSAITHMIPSSASDCSSNIGISELFNKDINLLAYPNPLNDVLNVTYNLNRSAILSIAMSDYAGNKIKQINLGKQNIGSHNFKINIDNISSGLYFLSIKINNRVETIKLIKP